MKPLVSVIISAFNSADFIEETLESIKNQSYENLELIITDDCSNDQTVEVCEHWINNNRISFLRAEVIKSNINTGVSANANRGLKAARGECIKFLGADDTLKVDCIKDNIDWILRRPEIKVLLSRIEIYMDTFLKENLIETTPGTPYSSNGILANHRNAESQYKMLLVNDRIHFSPSLFIESNAMREMDGFDERFKLLEDYPLWLNLTRAGYKIHFMDKITVNYRRHKKAINNTGLSFLINPNYYRAEYFRKIYTYPYLPRDLWLNAKYTWFISQLFRANFINRNTKLNQFLYSILSIYVNPFHYVIWLEKRLNKKLRVNEFYI